MAEGIFKHLLEKNNIVDINVSSAGINAFEGSNANEKAVYTLNKKGVDILNHRARRITKEIISDSDLILTMTNVHKRVILNIVPAYLNKVYTLKEYAFIINNEVVSVGDLDIDDPFGLDYSVYEKVADEVEEQINKIIKILK